MRRRPDAIVAHAMKGQRPENENGSFPAIAEAETALNDKFGRHVFEIAGRSRVSQSVYN
jgi:hypothetical protein